MPHFVAWLPAIDRNLRSRLAVSCGYAARPGLVWDLAIAAIALTVWMLAEAVPRRDRRSLPASSSIGVFFGLPPHLRSRRAD